MNNSRKIVKQIHINIDKCIGCRSCELACSAFHSSPRYSRVNPSKSRIRVMVDDLNDVYVPVRSGDQTTSECTGRHRYVIDGKEYRECSFCRSVCPTRGYFKDPDTGLPLICDMCESDPELEQPWCVTVCGCGTLTYVEKEEYPAEPDEPDEPDALMAKLEALTEKFSLTQVMDSAARNLKK